MKKARGVKFCTRVGLLSGQVFSPFGEDWLAGSHGDSGITSDQGLRCTWQRPQPQLTGQTRRWFDISSAGTCGEDR